MKELLSKLHKQTFSTDKIQEKYLKLYKEISNFNEAVI